MGETSLNLGRVLQTVEDSHKQKLQPRMNLGPGGRVPTFRVKTALSQSFWSNLRDFLAERPVKLPPSATKGSLGEDQFGSGFVENLKEWFRPLPASAKHLHSRMEVEWKPWYRSFWENLRDTIAPPKLPPVKITSKPVKVRDIWSRDENFKRAQALSLVVHAGIAVLLIVPLLHQISQPTQASNKPLLDPIDISPYLAKLPAGKDKAGGGGGGGERMNTPPTKGKLPRWSMTQFAKPMAVPRNENPRLAMEPTLLGPPDLRVPSPNVPNYGDPLAKLFTGSGGPGGGGGIGTGEGGGIGSGTGGGLGPGFGGGTGGGVFRAGTGGVGYPSCPYKPNPQYSEEARKAKYQGVVVLQGVITVEGKIVNISIIKGPGLGLEEKAVEAVKTWRCTPATGPNGKPVAVLVPIEVSFRLL